MAIAQNPMATGNKGSRRALGKLPWLLSLEEGPDHCRPVRLLGRRAQDSRSSPIAILAP